MTDLNQQQFARRVPIPKPLIMALPVIASGLFLLPLFGFPLLYVVAGIVGVTAVLASFHIPTRLIIFFMLVPIAQSGLGLVPNHPGFGFFDVYLIWVIGLTVFSISTDGIRGFRLTFPHMAVLIMIVTWLPGLVMVRDWAYSFRYAFSFTINVISLFLVYYYLQHPKRGISYKLILQILVIVTTILAIYGIYLTATSSSIVTVIASRHSNILTGDPNYYSCYLIMIISMAVGLAINERNRLWRLIYIACTGLMIISVVLAISRAGYVTMIIVTVLYGVYFYFELGLKRILGSVAVAALLTAGVVMFTTNMSSMVVNLFNISERVESAASGEDSSINQRMNILRVAFRMIAANPLLGVGYGNFEPAFNSYQLGLLSTQSSRVAHNTYLTIQAENGILGSAGALLFFGSIFAYLFHAFRRAKTLEVRTTVFSLTIAILAYMIMAGTLELLPEPRFWIFSALAIAYAKNSVFDVENTVEDAEMVDAVSDQLPSSSV